MSTCCDDHTRTYAHSDCPVHPWCWLSWPRFNLIWYQINLVTGSKQPPHLCQSFFGSCILWLHFLIYCSLTTLVLTGKEAEQSMFWNWKDSIETVLGKEYKISRLEGQSFLWTHQRRKQMKLHISHHLLFHPQWRYIACRGVQPHGWFSHLWCLSHLLPSHPQWRHTACRAVQPHDRSSHLWCSFNWVVS